MSIYLFRIVYRSGITALKKDTSVAFKFALVLLGPPGLKDDGKYHETKALDATSIDPH